MNLDQVTVVVPTKNERKNIRAFLDSLPAEIRLIVVDASDDDTPQIIASHRPLHTRVISHQSNIAEARQVGASVAETKWLIFTDADMVFARDYFETLHRVPEHDVIYGAKRSHAAFGRYYRFFVWGQGVLHRLGIPGASGSNLIMNRKAFDASGGFDLDLTCNEDTEIVWAARRAGCSVGFTPELSVYELDHRRLERGVLRKTLHSLMRCALLYTGLMPRRWRSGDWGYWSKPRRTRKRSAET